MMQRVILGHPSAMPTKHGMKPEMQRNQTPINEIIRTTSDIREIGNRVQWMSKM